ncbi:MAG: hypothetical protein ACTSPO_13155 [Candidatus Heimdallarchaeaceae archaeon]
MRCNITPILFVCIVTPLILGGFLSQCATDTTLIWEIEQNAMVTPIGVDDKNNLILYYLNPNDYGSQTRVMKYSSDGKIIYNDTMDFSYDYFHYLNKKIDREGNLFLFGKGLDVINIRKYDQNLDFIRSTTIEIGEVFSDFTLSPFFVSEIGSFYLLYNEEYNTLNSTHVSRSDDLYKINSDGEVIWKTTFDCVYYRSRTPPTFISENENSTLYFGYNKNVYRLDSEKGKIKWIKEYKKPIKGLTIVFNDVCVIVGDFSDESIEVIYISSDEEEVWSSNIKTEYGIISIDTLESKNDKIGIQLEDTTDGEITGKAIESIVIYNSLGERLVYESESYNVLFLQKKQFLLSYSDNFFSHFYNHKSGLNASSKTSMLFYEAPDYIPTNNTSVILTGIEFFLGIVIIIKSYKIYKNVRNSKKKI